METVVIVAGVDEPIVHFEADYIGVDQGCEFCLREKIVPVIGIGDFDSTNKTFTFPILKYPPQKDETDLELAIQYAIDKYDKIIVCNCIGKRSDHFLYNLKLLVKYPHIILMSQNEKIFVLEKGTHLIHNTYRYFSFFAITDSQISLIGFEYQLKNALIQPQDFKTISNTILNDTGKVIVHHGKILCIQTESKGGK